MLLYSLRSYMSSSADMNKAYLRANVDTKLLALDVLSLVIRELCLLITQASTSGLTCSRQNKCGVIYLNSVFHPSYCSGNTA